MFSDPRADPWTHVSKRLRRGVHRHVPAPSKLQPLPGAEPRTSWDGKGHEEADLLRSGVGRRDAASDRWAVLVPGVRRASLRDRRQTVTGSKRTARDTLLLHRVGDDRLDRSLTMPQRTSKACLVSSSNPCSGIGVERVRESMTMPPPPLPSPPLGMPCHADYMELPRELFLFFR